VGLPIILYDIPSRTVCGLADDTVARLAECRSFIGLKDATGALVRVIGGPTMTVSEAEKAAALVGGKISKRARIIWGCSVENSPEMENTIKVLLIITGVRATSLLGQKGGYAAGESADVIDLVR